MAEKRLKGSAVKQGDTPSFGYRLNPGSNPHFNSPGHTVRFVTKTNLDSEDGATGTGFVKTVGNGIVIESDLVCRIDLTPSDTRSLTVGASGLRLYYELQIAKNDNTKVYTIEQEPQWFMVSQDVARTAP